MPGMDFLPPIVLAALTGFVSGLVLSVPVGPVNLTILNEGARRGFAWAALIGLGATTMETIYCLLAFTCPVSFFTQPHVKAAMELVGFVFMLFLGVKFLLAKKVEQAAPFDTAAAGLERQLRQRFRPHSAFTTGMVRVMGNAGIFGVWIFLAGSFVARNLVTPDWPGRLACVGGVGLGTGTWFCCLTWLVSLRHGKISDRGLLKLEHGSGLVLLGAALFQALLIVREMAAHPR